MATKKKVAKAEDAEFTDDGPDFSSQIHRVLTALRTKSPIARTDLGMILQEMPPEFDFNALWDALKKNVHTKYEESTDKLFFEHELLNVRSQNLKEFIDKRRAGVSREELVEFNKDLSNTIAELLRSASVLPFLGWRGSNKKCLMMYPRGTDFRVPLSGTVSAKPETRFLETTHDLRMEIRRGDAIVVDGVVYRVSIEESGMGDLSVKELRNFIINDLGGDCGDIEERDLLEARAHALMNDKSVKRGSRKQTGESSEALERRNEYSSSSIEEPPPPLKGPIVYRYDFEANRLPLDRPFKGSVDNVAAYKFGCTNDVRDTYWKVAENSSNNFTVDESNRLDSKLAEGNLISEELLQGLNQNSRERRELHAKRLADAASGKSNKKQRRSNFPRKVTNVHMLDV